MSAGLKAARWARSISRRASSRGFGSAMPRQPSSTPSPDLQISIVSRMILLTVTLLLCRSKFGEIAPRLRGPLLLLLLLRGFGFVQEPRHALRVPALEDRSGVDFGERPGKLFGRHLIGHGF